MRVLVGLGLCLGMVSHAVYAQTGKAGETIKIWRSGTQSARQGDAEHFTGSVRVDPLFQPIARAHAGSSLVTFEAGARTAWHTHPLGQMLIVTSGTGRVQAWDEPAAEIRQGDVVSIPPGQEHSRGVRPGGRWRISR